jgi:m7GpppX diphosphatase
VSPAQNTWRVKLPEIELLSVFILDIHLDPATHSVALLGTLRPSPESSDTSDGQAKMAIVRIERTALPHFSDGLIATTKLVESTDIVSSSLTSPRGFVPWISCSFYQYAWMLGWLSHSEDRPDVKINVICPATEVHIRKVNPFRLMMASELRS